MSASGGSTSRPTTIRAGQTALICATRFVQRGTCPYAHADHHFLTAIPGNPGNGRIPPTSMPTTGAWPHSPDGGVSWQQIAGHGNYTILRGRQEARRERLYRRHAGQRYVALGSGSGRTVLRGPIPSEETGSKSPGITSNANLILGGSQFNGLKPLDRRRCKVGSPSRTFRALPDSHPSLQKLRAARSIPDLVFAVGSALAWCDPTTSAHPGR